MVYCFVPDCTHHSESHNCTFFTFPSKTKKNEEYKRWIRLIRRQDREPSTHARVCSCHFGDGQKSFGPEIFERNSSKLFPTQEGPPKTKKKKQTPLKENQLNIEEIIHTYYEQQSTSTSHDEKSEKVPTQMRLCLKQNWAC
ncbi:hypothetical protein QZH41_019536 [Actinostola sp. cb2023]|nr:hypothetical protein QZH41_019536 [Actinostola sp. cb2023]